MQCEDCKYTCHKKCYPKVVTKCISKSNAETDPDEEKLNHRIPHRFEAFSNMGANWCCHCGYMLPLGRKNCRKCSGKISFHADRYSLRLTFYENVVKHVTLHAPILFRISVACRWRPRTKSSLWPTRRGTPRIDIASLPILPIEPCVLSQGVDQLNRSSSHHRQGYRRERS